MGIIVNIEFTSPIKENDRVLIELKLSSGKQDARNNDHKTERNDFREQTLLRKYFK